MYVIDSHVNKIANKIQAELKRQEKLQKDLAYFLGISEGSLSRLLAGEKIKSKYMSKIASFLGVDMTFFAVNSNLKSVSSGNTQKEEEKEPPPNVDAWKEVIKAKEEVIKTKDELIRAKEELISTLKELKHKKE